MAIVSLLPLWLFFLDFSRFFSSSSFLYLSIHSIDSFHPLFPNIKNRKSSILWKINSISKRFLFYFPGKKRKKKKRDDLSLCGVKSHLELTNESLSPLSTPDLCPVSYPGSPALRSPFKPVGGNISIRERLQALSDPLFHPSSFIAFYFIFYLYWPFTIWKKMVGGGGRKQKKEGKKHTQIVVFHFTSFPLNFVSTLCC